MNILTQSTLANFDAWLETSRTAGGVLLIDKEKEWTSFDVVAKLRGITKIKKIGHAGTLDPLATGLLIVCCGAMTKQISTFQEQTKAYQTVVKLGAITKTDDAEAEEEQVQSTEHLTEAGVVAAVQKFVGDISQIPPMYSALKKNGVPLYKLARKGIEIEREARLVRVYGIETLNITLPLCTLNIECSKGTYIRALARDIGAELGVGGYMADLRRTGIGDFSVNDAVTMPQILEQRMKSSV
ncbi:MAG: tRNA pseudouridine(55) synthase TruB [Candidatus Kapaibacterium sp.]|nr:MAG: tRNA pseudouridine(55) synthase TruB [Candidatus Kapabacteria bacterium]